MESPKGPPQALVIGPAAVRAPLERFFARSYWILEQQSTLNAALERLKQECFPAVFCSADDSAPVARAVAGLDRPPLVIALSPERPPNGDWIEAVASNVYTLNFNALYASRLFPLLNRAWRNSA